MRLHTTSQRKISVRNQKGNLWFSTPRNEKQQSVADLGRSPKQMTRVLIADRDSLSSALLANALGNDRSFEAAAVQSGDLLQTLATGDVDLVVIASEFQGSAKSGFDLAHIVGRDYPNVSIVILLNHSNHDAVLSAFRAGARGVFCRDQPASEFLDCVESVVKGLIWAGRQETDFLLEAFRNIPALNVTLEDDSLTLTVRELHVVKCAAQGKTNKAIACQLGLSEHTVKNYLFRAFEKLGVSSRVELLFYLTQRGHRFGAIKAVSPEAELAVE